MTSAPPETAQSPTGGVPVPERPSRRGRRWPFVVGGVVLLVAGLAVAAEFAFRNYAESQIDSSIESSLPGNVHAEVASDIHGASSIVQWLHGSFDDVTISTTTLTILGRPASARIEAHGLPVDGAGAITNATGSITLSQAALRKLAPLASAQVGTPSLGNGTVGTRVVRKIGAVPITADVTLVPSVTGKSIHLAPIKATLATGGVQVNGIALVKALLPNGITVCAAQYLPPGVTVTAIDARTGSVTIDLVADRLDLAAAQDGRTGSC